MAQLSSKFLCISLLALSTFAAGCLPAPTRPTTVNLADRRGAVDDGDSKGTPKPNKPEKETPDTDPDKPVVEPEKPVVDPDKPVVEPEKPVVDPEKPVVEPEKPIVEPEKPIVEPKEPTMSELITEAQFNQLSKERLPFYTYKGFIEAAEATPKFAKTGSVEIRKREIAAMLANALHESDNFKAIHEYDESARGHYCMASAEYPCKEGQTYHGRGPIQISWNYNYINAGKALGVDLYNNPNLVSTDPKIAFQTLMWFWMTQGAKDQTCHDAIVNNKGGFAQTIKTINGGLECNPARTPIQETQAKKRGTFYKSTLAIFGLNAGNEYLDCI